MPKEYKHLNLKEKSKISVLKAKGEGLNVKHCLECINLDTYFYNFLTG